MEIAPSLADFSFHKDGTHDNSTFFQDDTHMDSDEEENEPMPDIAPDAPVQDFFQMDQGDDDFGGGDDYMGNDDFGGDDGGDDGELGSVGASAGLERNGPLEAFDPQANKRDLVVAMGDDDDNDGILANFDQNFQNWGGPAHWKTKRVVRKSTVFSSSFG